VTVNVLDDAEEVGHALAQRVVQTLRAKADAVLGLASGRSPIDGYAELRRLRGEGAADFSQASTFNLDEFAGISGDDPGSFQRFMRRHLFDGINLQPSRIHFLNGAAPDLDTECERYEQAIRAAGGIDLQILGIGTNGHIGFNEPGDDLSVRTHRVTLAESSRRDNAALFGGDASRVPKEALSMGIGTILLARRIVLVATGEKKAECIRAALSGRISTRVPASLLQIHGGVEFLLDTAAARMI